jgi:putative nucleotidyltransferase with HDIG domain
MNVDAAAILLYKKTLQTLTFSQGQGFRTAALQYTNLRLGRGFAGKIALDRRALFISDLNQDETGFVESLHLKKEGFVSYYGTPLIAKGELIGVLEIFHRSSLDPHIEWINFLQVLAGQAAIAIDNDALFNNFQRSNLELITAYDATIEGWAHALELRDMETEGHSRRVVKTTMKLAEALNFREEDLINIRRGALLHDIGKMGVPDAILQKPGKLTEEEWVIMRLHPVYAYEWLLSIEYLQPALDIPYCHHERWDGTGYPRGLKGKQTPLSARIFAIVDVWDALRSDRPYRKAWSKEKTLAHIQAESGKHFDPIVVETFLEVVASNKL